MALMVVLRDAAKELRALGEQVLAGDHGASSRSAVRPVVALQDVKR